MTGYIILVSPSSLTFSGLIEQAFKTEWRKLSDLPIVMIRTQDKWLGDDPDCRGVVLPVSYQRCLEMVRKLSFPIINTSERLPPVEAGINIRYDSGEMGDLAARHFTELGYSSFFFIGDPPAAFSEARLAGFADALQQNGHRLSANLSFIKKRRWDPATTLKEDVEQIREWIEDIGPAGAVLAANDAIATRFIRALKASHPEMADTVGLIGFDDDYSRLADLSEGEPITSIVPNFARTGKESARYLARAVHHNDYTPGSIVHVQGAKLVERQTTGGFVCKDLLLTRIARWISREINQGRSPSVAEVLARFPMSERTLCDKFSKFRGESMRDFIMHKRIQRAARMLLDSSMRVSEIAQLCGFNKHADLTERFRKYTGLSPTEFRKNPLAGNHAFPGK